jgi:uncharacterized protein (DUF2336 family)
LQAETRERSPEYRVAHTNVETLHNSGKLSEPELLAFARTGKFDETSVALSLMCGLPIGVVERAMAHEKCDQLLVLGKSIGLAFATVKAIAVMRAPETAGRPPRDMKEAAASYGRLRYDVARNAIHYYRLRERAGLN